LYKEHVNFVLSLQLEWANTQDVAIKDAGAIRLAQRVFDKGLGKYQYTT